MHRSGFYFRAQSLGWVTMTVDISVCRPNQPCRSIQPDRPTVSRLTGYQR